MSLMRNCVPRYEQTSEGHNGHVTQPSLASGSLWFQVWGADPLNIGTKIAQHSEEVCGALASKTEY
jgi:hypothetical protein